jgi:hypothetical protein
MTLLPLVLSLVAIVLTVLSFGLALYAIIIVKAMEKSTHSIQFEPVDKTLEKELDKLTKKDIEQHQDTLDELDVIM